MEYIQIPVPDFSFEDIAKEKAKSIIRFHLYASGLLMFVRGGNTELEDRVEDEINTLYHKGEKIICINELLTHLANNIRDVKDQPNQTEDNFKFYLNEINKIRYKLYGIASFTVGYNFDKNAFTDDEITDLVRKINAILIKLDEIQVGNEVIFNEVEEIKEKLKEDFESLKSDFPLGKKRWYQRAAGVVVTYSGTKAADEILKQIRPELHDFFINQAPHLVHKLIS